MSGVRRLQEQVVELNQLLYADHHEKHHAIITENPEMLSNIAKAKRLAASNIPVTIVGETGTGKELFSCLIHQCSKRANKPFIALNCGALPPTLIESTLSALCAAPIPARKIAVAIWSWQTGNALS